MSSEEREKSQRNAEKFCENMHKIDKNFGVDLIKVNEVGGIDQECILTYLGVKVAHIPPRPPALFGFRIFGEFDEIKVGKNNRIYSEHEQNILQNALLKKAEHIKQEFEQTRKKQKETEDKTRKTIE